VVMPQGVGRVIDPAKPLIRAPSASAGTIRARSASDGVSSRRARRARGESPSTWVARSGAKPGRDVNGVCSGRRPRRPLNTVCPRTLIRTATVNGVHRIIDPATPSVPIQVHVKRTMVRPMRRQVFAQLHGNRRTHIHVIDADTGKDAVAIAHRPRRRPSTPRLLVRIL